MWPSEKVSEHIFYEHVVKWFSIYEGGGYLYEAECPLCKKKSIELSHPERIKIFIDFSCGCKDKVEEDLKTRIEEGLIHRGRNYYKVIYIYFRSPLPRRMVPDESNLPEVSPQQPDEIEKSRLEEITRLHNEILNSLKLSLEKVIRIGELLTEQKETLKHGEFMTWVKDNLFFTDRTARNYMRIYRERDRLKTETVSDLTGAYKLIEHKKRIQLSEEEKVSKKRERTSKIHNSIRFRDLQRAWRDAENPERKAFLREILLRIDNNLDRYRKDNKTYFSENDNIFYADIDKRCSEIILWFGCYYNGRPKRMIHRK